MRRVSTAIVVAITLLGLAAAAAADDVAAVRQLLMATFDKPEAPLVVAPVVVAGDHAVADWSQGERGGRALLRRARPGGEGWSLVLCAGDGIRAAEALRQAGVPAADAQTLATRLADAERALSPERRALFATFEGIVTMHGSGAANH
ncbi:copper uptake system-associated protein [Bradyrhizobium sp. 2TAF24]|uniref:copper uptake system-associated protein n=1 Tax=Bradyrhizobium sp. 2TAF24 TaxID=3233011 RepID=UPI003F8F3866